jgi:hypothetical protein
MTSTWSACLYVHSKFRTTCLIFAKLITIMVLLYTTPKTYVDCSAFSNKNMADARTRQTAVTLDIRSRNEVSSPSVELGSLFNVVFS